MKLRIHDNSIRLRLTRGEVDRIARGDAINERLGTAPLAFEYRLTPANPRAMGDGPVAIEFAGFGMDIRVTDSVIRTWGNSSEVGLYFDAAGENGVAIRVAIERDFKCLHGESENDPDCYPNPLAEVEGKR